MKKITLSLILVTSVLMATAQQTGTVTYSRTMQMQVNISDNDALQQAMPRTRTDRFELAFAANRSLWKHMEDEISSDEASGGGMQIRMVAPGQNEVVFHDLNTLIRTSQREFMGRNFLVTDTVQKLDWKITGETKQVLGYTCQQAIAQRIGTRMMMNMENGKLERKEVADTVLFVAWFTTAIPVSAGPEVQGQLPGLILALDMNNGRMVYQAVQVSAKADEKEIKAPTKGKKMSQQEFVAERTKLMEEMRKNNQGRGNQVIRMN